MLPPPAMMKPGRSPWPQWVWAEPCLAPPSCPQRWPPHLFSIPKFSLWQPVCCWNWGNPAGPVPVSPPPVLRGRDQLFGSGPQAGGVPPQVSSSPVHCAELWWNPLPSPPHLPQCLYWEVAPESLPMWGGHLKVFEPLKEKTTTFYKVSVVGEGGE